MAMLAILAACHKYFCCCCSSDTVSVYRIPMSETLDADKSPRKKQITMIVRYSTCEQ